MQEHANSVILKPGRPMRDRLEIAAKEWLAAGRSADWLLTGAAFFMAQCWLYSSGAYKPESATSGEDITDLVEASRTALGGEAGWNAALSERESCHECHMTFRLENLGICTECAGYVCGGCRAKHTRCNGEVVG